ncbi:unnamed protein product [Calicophoron daubneyi]|uniref:gamma-glutamylcyclotransferase n=1 Tax=Calicophoron daubneyi TaxID=300641 RepID=A0AAV2TTK2_CALDB
MMDRQFFYYFAYGSNLLKQRIQLRNSSAQYVGVGRLLGYTLQFCGRSINWGGSPATIVPDPSSCVYGAVWTLDKKDLPSLDSQEGVPFEYTPFELSVLLSVDKEEKLISCRTYHSTSSENGLPSPYYMDVILRGCIQSNIPSSYVDRLRKVKHNNYFGSCKVYTSVLSTLDPKEKDQFQIEELRNVICGPVKA